MKIRTAIKIDKNPAATWEIMGNQFAHIDKWASFFKSSKPSGGNKFEGIDFAARETVVEGGENTHSLDVFDSENHVLSYTVTAGTPPFADKAQAEWALESTSAESCIASIEVNMELKAQVPEEKELEVKAWLSKSSEGMLEELKYYVETGNVHPRKVNAN